MQELSAAVVGLGRKHAAAQLSSFRLCWQLTLPSWTRQTPWQLTLVEITLCLLALVLVQGLLLGRELLSCCKAWSSMPHHL